MRITESIVEVTVIQRPDDPDISLEVLIRCMKQVGAKDGATVAVQVIQRFEMG